MKIKLILLQLYLYSLNLLTTTCQNIKPVLFMQSYQGSQNFKTSGYTSIPLSSILNQFDPNTVLYKISFSWWFKPFGGVFPDWTHIFSLLPTSTSTVSTQYIMRARQLGQCCWSVTTVHDQQGSGFAPSIQNYISNQNVWSHYQVGVDLQLKQMSLYSYQMDTNQITNQSTTATYGTGYSSILLNSTYILFGETSQFQRFFGELQNLVVHPNVNVGGQSQVFRNLLIAGSNIQLQFFYPMIFNDLTDQVTVKDLSGNLRNSYLGLTTSPSIHVSKLGLVFSTGKYLLIPSVANYRQNTEVTKYFNTFTVSFYLNLLLSQTQLNVANPVFSILERYISSDSVNPRFKFYVQATNQLNCFNQIIYQKDTFCKEPSTFVTSTYFDDFGDAYTYTYEQQGSNSYQYVPQLCFGYPAQCTYLLWDFANTNQQQYQSWQIQRQDSKHQQQQLQQMASTTIYYYPVLQPQYWALVNIQVSSYMNNNNNWFYTGQIAIDGVQYSYNFQQNNQQTSANFNGETSDNFYIGSPQPDANNPTNYFRLHDFRYYTGAYWLSNKYDANLIQTPNCVVQIADTCIKCDTGYVLINGTCVLMSQASCPTNQFLQMWNEIKSNSAICPLACPRLCLTCNNLLACITCQPPRINPPNCQCPNNTYDDPVTGLCSLTRVTTAYTINTIEIDFSTITNSPVYTCTGCPTTRTQPYPVSYTYTLDTNPLTQFEIVYAIAALKTGTQGDFSVYIDQTGYRFFNLEIAAYGSTTIDYIKINYVVTPVNNGFVSERERQIIKNNIKQNDTYTFLFPTKFSKFQQQFTALVNQSNTSNVTNSTTYKLVNQTVNLTSQVTVTVFLTGVIFMNASRTLTSVGIQVVFQNESMFTIQIVNTSGYQYSLIQFNYIATLGFQAIPNYIIDFSGINVFAYNLNYSRINNNTQSMKGPVLFGMNQFSATSATGIFKFNVDFIQTSNYTLIEKYSTFSNYIVSYMSLAMITIQSKCYNQTCLLCSYAPNYCQTCAAGGKEPFCGCNVQAGNYLASDGSCQNCNPACASCALNSDLCTSCAGFGRNILQKCACITGYFQDPNGVNCYQCNFQCYTCAQSSAGCLICNGNRVNPPNCTCPLYTAEFNQQRVDCPACLFLCQACSPDVRTCTVCRGDRVAAPLCRCPGTISTNLYDYTNQVCCQYAAPTVYVSDNLMYIWIVFFTDIQFMDSVSTNRQVMSYQNCLDLISQASINLYFSASTTLCAINSTNQSVFVIQTSSFVIRQSNVIVLNTGVIKYQICSTSLPIILINSVLNLYPPQNPQGTNITVNFYNLGYLFTCLQQQFQILTLVNDFKYGISNIVWSLNQPTGNNSYLKNISTFMGLQNGKKIVTFPVKFFLPNQTHFFQLSYQNFWGVNSTINFTQFTTLYVVNQAILSSSATSYPINQIITLLLTVNKMNCTSNTTVYTPLMLPGYFTLSQTDGQDIILPAPVTINKDQTTNQVSYSFQPYTMLPSQTFQFSTQFFLQPTDIAPYNLYTITSLLSPFVVQIVGGNRIQGFGADLNLVANAYDPNVPVAVSTIGFGNYSWTCFNLVTQAPCVDVNQNLINFTNTTTQTVPKYSLTPYQAYAFKFACSKAGINYTSQVNIVVSELDIPPITMSILNTRLSGVYNQNEELYFSMQYSNPNNDPVSYAATVIYEGNSVSTLGFSYTTFRVTIWNHVLKWNTDTFIQVRGTAYNPNFFMPSVATVSVQLNIPSTLCVFSITPSVGTALQTQFIFTIINCSNGNQPLQYRFGYYTSQMSLQQDLNQSTYNNIIILEDYNLIPNMTTTLPFTSNDPNVNSINVPVIGQVIDSLGGVLNLTSNVTIMPNLQANNLAYYISQFQPVSNVLQSSMPVIQMLCPIIANQTDPQPAMPGPPVNNIANVMNYFQLKQYIVSQINYFLQNSNPSSLQQAYLISCQSSLMQAVSQNKTYLQNSDIDNDIGTFSNQYQNSAQIITLIQQKIYNGTATASDLQALQSNKQIIRSSAYQINSIFTGIGNTINQTLSQANQNPGSRVLQQTAANLSSYDFQMLNQIINISQSLTLTSIINEQAITINGNQVTFATEITDLAHLRLLLKQNVVQNPVQTLAIILSNYSYPQGNFTYLVSEINFQRNIYQNQPLYPYANQSNPVNLLYVNYSNGTYTNILNSAPDPVQFTYNLSSYQAYFNDTTRKYNYVCVRVDNSNQTNSTNWTNNACTTTVKDAANGIVNCACNYFTPSSIFDDVNYIWTTKPTTPGSTTPFPLYIFQSALFLIIFSMLIIVIGFLYWGIKQLTVIFQFVNYKGKAENKYLIEKAEKKKIELDVLKNLYQNTMLKDETDDEDEEGSEKKEKEEGDKEDSQNLQKKDSNQKDDVKVKEINNLIQKLKEENDYEKKSENIQNKEAFQTDRDEKDAVQTENQLQIKVNDRNKVHPEQFDLQEESKINSESEHASLSESQISNNENRQKKKKEIILLHDNVKFKRKNIDILKNKIEELEKQIANLGMAIIAISSYDIEQQQTIYQRLRENATSLKNKIIGYFIYLKTDIIDPQACFYILMIYQVFSKLVRFVNQLYEENKMYTYMATLLGFFFGVAFIGLFAYIFNTFTQFSLSQLNVMGAYFGLCWGFQMLVFQPAIQFYYYYQIITQKETIGFKNLSKDNDYRLDHEVFSLNLI